MALWVWFVAWAVALSVVDIRQHRLPNAMVAVCFLGCLAIASLGTVALGEWSLLIRALGASLVAVAAFAVAHVIGGMGMGDVKYAAVTGLALGTIGWSAVWWGHFLGFLVAGVVVVIGWLTRSVHRQTRIPFGPFMALGASLVGVGALLGA